MTTPIGDNRSSPSYFQPSTPVIVVDVSPSLFQTMRGLVNVIQVTHFQSASTSTASFDHHFRPMRPVVHLSSTDELDVDLDTTTSQSEPKPIEPSAKTSNVQPEGALRQEPDKTQSEESRPGISLNMEIPYLDDPQLKKGDKNRYQKMVVELLDRIARLVKEMNIAKEITKQVIVQQTVKKDVPEAAKQQPTENVGKEKIFSSTETPILKHMSDAESVGLVFKKTGVDGQTEQIVVEKAQLPELLFTLHALLKNPSEGADVHALSELLFNVEKQLSQQGVDPTHAMRETGTKIQEGSLEQLNNQFFADPSARLSPLSLGGAIASFMPFKGGEPSRDVGLFEENTGNTVERVEKANSTTKFGSESHPKTPKEISTDAQVVKDAAKTDKQREVQEIAEMSKEHRSKKIEQSTRVDERLVPVGGKFTVDQLRDVRRRRSKGEKNAPPGQGDPQNLMNVLYMILAAVVCGAETVTDVTAFIDSREKWFRTLLGIRGSLPTTQLVTKLISSFHPIHLGEMLNRWFREAQGAALKSGLASLMVTETFEGLIFGQERTDGILTADLSIPFILRFIDMRELVVLTTTHRPIRKINEMLAAQGAHFIYDCGEEPLPNEGAVLPLFEQAVANPKEVTEVGFTESYLEGKEYLQLFEVPSNSDGGIRSTSLMISHLVTTEGKEEILQYFTSSLPKQSVWLFELLRMQRGLETKMEWMLNMSMRTRHPGQSGFAAREFLIFLRRYARDLLIKEQSFQAPLPAKHQRAFKENEYLLKVLKI